MKMEAALGVLGFLHLSMLQTVNCKLKKGHFLGNCVLNKMSYIREMDTDQT